MVENEWLMSHAILRVIFYSYCTTYYVVQKRILTNRQTDTIFKKHFHEWIMIPTNRYINCHVCRRRIDEKIQILSCFYFGMSQLYIMQIWVGYTQTMCVSSMGKLEYYCLELLPILGEVRQGTNW
jgi:hypothetical protein